MLHKGCWIDTSAEQHSTEPELRISIMCMLSLIYIHISKTVHVPSLRLVVTMCAGRETRPATVYDVHSQIYCFLFAFFFANIAYQ